MTTPTPRPRRYRADAVEAQARWAAGRAWRRRLAYAILIGYAILMFIPFALVGRSRRSRRCPTRST